MVYECGTPDRNNYGLMEGEGRSRYAGWICSLEVAQVGAVNILIRLSRPSGRYDFVQLSTVFGTVSGVNCEAFHNLVEKLLKYVILRFKFSLRLQLSVC